MLDISINGLDSSGKSQQVKLLTFNNPLFYAPKALVKYGNSWPKFSDINFSNWWFNVIDIDELTSIIIEALNYRYLDKPKDKVRIFDRGTKMFKAVCVATRVTRTSCSFDSAVDKTNASFNEQLAYPENEVNVLLVPDKTYMNSIKHLVKIVDHRSTIKYPDSIEEIYRSYQKNLQSALEFYFADTTSIAIDDSIFVIHNRIRETLSDLSNIQFPETPSVLAKVIGFSGLSESGKSTLAEYLRVNCGFYRLKLKYFSQDGIITDAKISQEMTAFEILKFLNSHYFVKNFTIESFHGSYLMAYLKLLLGDMFTVVYIDVPLEKRIQRSVLQHGTEISICAEQIAEKDQIKKHRGIEQIGSFADIIFDNSTDDANEACNRFASLFIN